MNASMNESPLVQRILHLAPCEEAKIWLSAYDDPTKAWTECARGDWMLWYIAQQIVSPGWSDDRKPLLACALDCALTVRHLWPESHRDEMTEAVETLRAWCRGEASLDAAKAARETLKSAYYAADAAAVAVAVARAAARAAYAAYAAAATADHTAFAASDSASAYYAAAYAVRAADTAASAYYAAAADRAAALSKMQTTTADIVRQHYPHPPACAAS